MNFIIPRNNETEFLIYLWKIIDMPIISKTDLLYKISFELFLDSPENAKQFIVKSIQNKNLSMDKNNNLYLSQNLEKKLENWQKERKNMILNNLQSTQQKTKVIEKFDKNSESDFNNLLKAFLDKGTINRAVTVSDSSITIKSFDFNKGFIKADVIGSKKDSYNIEINITSKELIHNCHDFQERQAPNNKFCKHLAKLFIVLKEKNEVSALKFLKEIAKNINEWKFLS